MGGIFFLPFSSQHNYTENLTTPRIVFSDRPTLYFHSDAHNTVLNNGIFSTLTLAQYISPIGVTIFFKGPQLSPQGCHQMKTRYFSMETHWRRTTLFLRQDGMHLA